MKQRGYVNQAGEFVPSSWVNLWTDETVEFPDRDEQLEVPKQVKQHTVKVIVEEPRPKEFFLPL